MSSTGSILKKKKDVEFDKLIQDIKLAAIRAGLEARINSDIQEDEYDGGVWTTGNIADTYENIPGAQQWLMYIFSDRRVFFEYGDVSAEEGLIRVVLIEGISDCKRILLDFLFEYLKLNPKDYFWTSVSGCRFTYEDIKKVKKNKYDPNWCWKNPHADSSDT